MQPLEGKRMRGFKKNNKKKNLYAVMLKPGGTRGGIISVRFRAVCI